MDNHFSKKYRGLNDEEVIKSREKYGYNQLEETKKETLFSKIIEIFKEPMFVLLLSVSTLYFILGEISDGMIMLVFIVFIIAIEVVQERRTDKALETLKMLSSLNAKVIRNNSVIEIDNKEIVVGDIVVLNEGDTIPADGIIIENEELGINESILTGESAIVNKKLEDNSDDYFKKNICYSGTIVTSGSAIIRIEKIGIETEYGKIGKSLNNIVKNKTPLEKQIKKLIISFTIVSITFLILVVAVNIGLNPDNHKGFVDILIHAVLAGITVAMATIPEEIPVVLTIFMAMGAFGLAKKNTLIRNMNSVETLGSISVLCVDKTGTLTKNEMVIKEIFTEEKNFIDIMALTCPIHPFDPMDKAIVEHCKQNGLSKNIFKNKLIKEYLFNSEDKMIGKIWNINNENILNVKGAYENVLPLCNLEKEYYEKLKNIIEKYSKLGYRVISFATSNDQEIKEKITDYNLNFVGLIALEDPPRDGVKESIKSCYNAGIRVIMITGDNGETAKGIAEQINLNHGGKVITGIELEKMSDEELREKVKETNIFARVYPNHKTRIVEALQFNNEIVAMTGDGVNDAAALKKAEIGISMGKRGTNVAKEASDMILADDNFNTIVDSVENGRLIYNNIAKAISYIILIHIPIALLTLLTPVFGLPIFILPIHVVILELIIDPTSSIIFQRIKSTKNVMNKKPRPLNSSIINKTNLLLSIFKGLIMFLIIFLSYLILIRQGFSKEFSSTFAFSILMFSNVFIVYSIQTEAFFIKNMINNIKDRVIVTINGITIIGILLIIYLPSLNKIVGTTPLTIFELISVILISFSLTLVFDIIKFINLKIGGK